MAGVVQPGAEQAGVVHQLLGDAAHVDARPAEAPLRALRGRLDEVKQRHAGPEAGRLLGRRPAGGGEGFGMAGGGTPPH